MWEVNIVGFLPLADEPHTLPLNVPQNTDTDAYRLHTDKVRLSVSK